MIVNPHWLDELVLGGLFLLALAILARFARELPPRPRWLAWVSLAFMAFLIVFSTALSPMRINQHFSRETFTWIRCSALFAGAASLYGVALCFAFRAAGAFRPERRRFLQIAGAGAVAAPAALATFAIVKRDDLVFREVDLKLPSIARDLDGLRLVQLSDIHLSSFVSESDLARAVAMANEARPHLAFVTGDLVTTKGDPLDAALKQLSRLRADAGIYGCMGNHEEYARATRYTDENGARLGIRFLRREATQLMFGNARLNLAGVDYQLRSRKYLEGAEELIDPQAFNVLLSHNPDVFPVAAGQGFDLTLAGHTHGGQVTFEVIHPALNVARFFTPYVYGLYENGGRAIYVTRGIGTIGVPARLGAPPEVALIRLCATSS
jgi:predicted MPP superfamily phosphohydrolase